jgi:hypothetical protein
MKGKNQGQYFSNQRSQSSERGLFLHAFAKLRKATISFVMSVSPSAWNNSALTGWIFMKSGISVFSENMSASVV